MGAVAQGTGMTRRGWLYLAALGVLWGIPYLLIKVAVRQVPPPLLVFIRTGGAAVLLGPLAVSRGTLRPVLRRWRPLVVYTAVEMGGPWFLLFGAEQHVPSSFAALLIASVPLAAAALAWLTGTERIGPRRLGGLVLGLAGVGIVVGVGLPHSQLPAVLALCGVVCGYALGPWIVAHHLSDLPPLGVVTASCLLCTVGYAPAAALELPARPLSGSVVWSVAGLVVLCTAAAFLVFFALIAEAGAVRSTLVTYINPAVAVVLGVGLLGEPFGAGSVAGFVVILAGCYLASRPVDQVAALPPVAEP
jgi:drug/metabolite transporter (DMT)-like permease